MNTNNHNKKRFPSNLNIFDKNYSLSTSPHSVLHIAIVLCQMFSFSLFRNFTLHRRNENTTSNLRKMSQNSESLMSFYLSTIDFNLIQLLVVKFRSKLNLSQLQNVSLIATQVLTLVRCYAKASYAEA